VPLFGKKTRVITSVFDSFSCISLKIVVVFFMLNIAVLGSGRGSNFQAILSAVHAGQLPNVRIRLVVSNNSSAGILEIARGDGIPALHLSQRQFTDESAFAGAMLAAFRRAGVNFLVLAGYMKRVPAAVVQAFPRRIINIHPALLPRFGGEGMYGIHVHEAVIASHAATSGATVHFVDEEYDHGATVLQKEIPVLPDDTPATLASRVLEVEHEILPEALRRLASAPGDHT
jgi:phosphoribosylglycinamide formyltransferase-1